MSTQVANYKAKWTYEKVSHFVENANKEQKKNFRSYVKKLPMLIQYNGLGNAFAFVFSKKKGNESYDAWNYIYNIIYEWITNYYHLIPVQDDLMQTILNLNSYEYRQLTNEIITVLNWLRRFAEGLIEVEEINN